MTVVGTVVVSGVDVAAGDGASAFSGGSLVTGVNAGTAAMVAATGVCKALELVSAPAPDAAAELPGAAEPDPVVSFSAGLVVGANVTWDAEVAACDPDITL